MTASVIHPNDRCATMDFEGAIDWVDPIHRCRAVTTFLAAGAAQRLHLEPLPGYAPDVNPVEGVWRYLKRVELRNRCCRDLAELTGEFRRAVARLRHKRPILKAGIRHAGYPVWQAIRKSIGYRESRANGGLP